MQTFGDLLPEGVTAPVTRIIPEPELATKTSEPFYWEVNSDPNLRDKVVADYRAAKMGGERYGVVCGIINPETGDRCMKRICLQGWSFAVDNSGEYCLHRENYDGEAGEVDNITSVLAEHGLPWRPLMTKVQMTEATSKKKKRKKAKKNVN